MITLAVGLVLGSYFSDEIKLGISYIKIKAKRYFK
jgi:hypothetical protein